MNRSPRRMLGSKNLETRRATGLNSRYRERKHRLSSCPAPRLSSPLLFHCPLSLVSLSRTYKFSFLPFTNRYELEATITIECRCYCPYGATILMVNISRSISIHKMRHSLQTFIFIRQYCKFYLWVVALYYKRAIWNN